MIEYRTYSHLARATADLCSQLPRDLSCVMGIPRSGMIPATMVASSLHLPLGMVFTDSTVVTGGARLPEDEAKKGRVLLLDDSIRTGDQMAKALEYLEGLGLPRDQMVTAVVYASEESLGAPLSPDFHAEILGDQRLFEWNLFGSDSLPTALLDMDGVICQDPEPFDDDGRRYQLALEQARPLHVPRKPILGVVTNRLERWREITHRWLLGHGVEYHRMDMQPFRTAKERRAQSDPAVFKAGVYQDSAVAGLFIESNDRQARAIHAACQKPVFSVEGNRLFQ